MPCLPVGTFFIYLQFIGKILSKQVDEQVCATHIYYIKVTIARDLTNLPVNPSNPNTL